MAKTIAKANQRGKQVVKSKPVQKTKAVKVTKSNRQVKQGYTNSWKIEIPKALSSVENVELPLPPAWPARALIFKIYQAFESSCELTKMILAERGWQNGGDPCNPKNTNILEYIVAGKHTYFDEPIPKQYWLPRRGYWIGVDDAEIRKLHKLPNGEWNRVSGFPGCEPASYKTSCAKAMRGKPFIPETFILPAEKDKLIAAAKKDKDNNIKSMWIGKPKNNWSGRGITVYPSGHELFQGSLQQKSMGVLQRYITNPFLVSGYKSHFRIHIIITGIKPCRAYMHYDSHIMFCTKPFSLDDNTVGNDFDNKRHLSNFDINASSANYELFASQKGLVGPGVCWNIPMFQKHLKQHRKDLSWDHIWQQMKVVAHHSAVAIASHPTILQQKIIPHRNDELVGIDMMLDDNGKVWLLEYNSSPGTETTGCHLENGEPNPDLEADQVTIQLIHDKFALLGMDREHYKGGKGSAGNFERVA